MMKPRPWQPVLALRPTQFSIGLLEVEAKALELKKLDPTKRRETLKQCRIPVIVAPWKALYATDHHHLLFACWHIGVKEVKVEVLEDLSDAKLTYDSFWKHLVTGGRAYLYDQFGKGPHAPIYLPSDVRGLAADPYRALAWAVREAGGYQNTDEAFAEFKWADFFRKADLLIPQGLGYDRFAEAIAAGLQMAGSDRAKRLPGYNPEGAADPKCRLKARKIRPLPKENGVFANTPLFKN
jgi:hypothetical protein